MPPRTQEKGKLPHTCHIWVIFDTNGNRGAPQRVGVLEMARKWHRCHNRRAWSSNSNTTKGRQPLSSCSFTFIKDQTVSYLRKENSTTFFQCLLYLQHTLLTGGCLSLSCFLQLACSAPYLHPSKEIITSSHQDFQIFNCKPK